MKDADDIKIEDMNIVDTGQYSQFKLRALLMNCVTQGIIQKFHRQNILH